ncbi:MAG: pilin [Plesiomonas sp.]|uniref:pilin n=1 Tax=Plesiomonas sp. TaxID=2486279 RepID=UPI003F2FCEE9
MMNKMKQGFTLIELMIVVAIVAILAAIALPAYQSYTKKAKFTEVINATAGVKQQVELCIFDFGSAHADCANGKKGNGWDIKVNTAYDTPYVKTITVAAGVITVIPQGNGFAATDTYTLTPTIGSAGQVKWAAVCADPTLC